MFDSTGLIALVILAFPIFRRDAMLQTPWSRVKLRVWCYFVTIAYQEIQNDKCGTSRKIKTIHSDYEILITYTELDISLLKKSIK